MPKLWNTTLATHRREVRDAILDAGWTLANTHGPAAVTMSEVAAQAGIGRATLYKYFPSIQAILAAWHQRHIEGHLSHLAEVRSRTDNPGERLQAVLEAYARIYRHRVQHQRTAHGVELASLLHSGDDVTRAQGKLHRLIRDLLSDAAKTGRIRGDISSDELASYCLYALAAAGTLKSDVAIRRLVDITLTGLRHS